MASITLFCVASETAGLEGIEGAVDLTRPEDSAGGWPIFRRSRTVGSFSCPFSFCGLQVEPTPGRAQTFILAGCKYSPHPFLFSS
jgi:hypothetical protein